MLIAIIVLSLISLAGFFWLAAVMFKRHVLWGSAFIAPTVIIVAGLIAGSQILLQAGNALAVLAFLASIIFAVMNWAMAKKAFLTYLLSSIALTGIIVSEVIGIMQHSDMIAIQDQMASGQMTEEQAYKAIQDVIQQKLVERYIGNGRATVSDDDLMTPEEAEIAALTEELRIKNEQAAASVEYAEQLEEQRQREAIQAEPDLEKVKVFNPVSISEAAKFTGQKFRIVTENGVEKQGILLNGGFDRMIFERKLAGGNFKFEVLNRDIRKLEVEQWEMR